MAGNVTELLGAPYENLIEAQVDKSPSEIVISNNGGETYYIVTPEVYDSDLKQEGFEIVVSAGE
ncbi:hypothetical protein IEC97_14530 [Neobacillus cucumis]|uniref:hypothetical protein n=1 Tax=Neobacillus cucumis TaxID=1740721 RepID=UPI0018E0398B|nr:hypothetical protein [Neobacillus cucumis]MBI0578579.1 hypothetical protein [Neobacillus cucumis]WHY93680.1 hypothetical protein QNK12_09550 [Neobacillus cucumis]